MGGNLEYLILTIKPSDNEAKIQEKEKFIKKNWKFLVTMNTCKSNFICNGRNVIPDEVIEQKEVFDNQLAKYVNTEDCKVAILNAFPIFLFDYYGSKIIMNKG